MRKFLSGILSLLLLMGLLPAAYAEEPALGVTYEIFVASFQDSDGDGIGDLQGILMHQATQQEWRFATLTEMLRICEHCLNCMGGPRHTHRLRAFYGNLEKEEISPMEFNETKTWQPDEPNTFIIRVQHRQNASWQGSVQWVEGGKEQHFRSALELIKLMDSAAGSDRLPEQREQARD